MHLPWTTDSEESTSLLKRKTKLTQCAQYGRFSAASLKSLESVYQKSPYPDSDLKRKLVEDLNVKWSKVNDWFVRRRRSDKFIVGKL